jgi:hypothetical protein
MPKPGLSHKKVFGPPFDYSRAAEIGEEVFRTLEVRHLDVYGTQLSECMSVGARSGRRAQDFTQVFRAAIGLLVGPRVENLDDVNQIGQILDGFFTEVPPRRVIRMFEIHKTALVLDCEHGFSRRETTLNGPLQEQSDELAGGRHDLFADYDARPDLGLDSKSANDRVVVCQKDRSQPETTTPREYLFWLARAIKRRRAVNVKVDPDQQD